MRSANFYVAQKRREMVRRVSQVYVARKRRSTDFEALEFVKCSVGSLQT